MRNIALMKKGTRQVVIGPRVRRIDFDCFSQVVFGFSIALAGRMRMGPGEKALRTLRRQRPQPRQPLKHQPQPLKHQLSLQELHQPLMAAST